VRSRTLLAALTLLLTGGEAIARDRLCEYLRAFERAPFESVAGKLQPRWIDVHWIGIWLDLDKGWHLECRPSEALASHAFCNWLRDNTSFEFSDDLALRILTCHGYRFPEWRDIWLGRTYVGFYLPSAGQYLLDIDLRDRQDPDRAIRLAIFPPQRDEATDKLPPLINPENLPKGEGR
jgi:hypothetical protein